MLGDYSVLGSILLVEPGHNNIILWPDLMKLFQGLEK